MFKKDTIVALATPSSVSAISVIRMSGLTALNILSEIFRPYNNKQKITNYKTHTIHFGSIYENNEILDDVLVSIFHCPHSYTGENSVEISCHGSTYIQQKIIELLIEKGARMAEAGEFTLRAFLNNKVDLSQAEAIGDLIMSKSKSAHDIAVKQMRGGFSNIIKDLRKQLLNFSSLIELELDFSEEDVEFVDRIQILKTIQNIKEKLLILKESFKLGNILKEGIPVAIIGKPNVGKSTLLNVILNDEKAIVSDIPGTTRDAIEDTIIIDGIAFRFIDTAGLRASEDELELFGIARTYQKINEASIILYVFDISQTNAIEIKQKVDELKSELKDDDKKIIVIGNKIDNLVSTPTGFKELVELETIFISAKRKENINMINASLLRNVKSDIKNSELSLVSNLRHYEALTKSLEAISSIEKGINQKISSVLISIDIKDALQHLGQITGEITTENILSNIFQNFCIGK